MIAMSLAEIAAVVGGQAHGDAHVTAPASLDSRAVEPGGLFVALAGEQVDGHDYVGPAIAAGAAAALTSRQVDDAPAVVVDDVTVALGLLARHVLDQVGPTVIAITGSQGKTGVKDMLAQLLMNAAPTVATAGNLNNELGVPLTLLRMDESTRFLVVEMGARGIGHIARLCEIAPPDIAIVLNVGRAHLGEFGSVENIATAKGELVEALRPDGTAVLNADDAMVVPMAERTPGRVVWFGRQARRMEDVEIVDVAMTPSGEPDVTLAWNDEVDTFHVPLLGEHQAANLAAALCTVHALGLVDSTLPLADLDSASPMRMERHVRPDGLVVVDDSYNANPDSMAAALHALAGLGEGRRVAVLGEMLELGGGSLDAHVDVGRLAAELGVDRVVAVGAGAAGIAEGAGERGTAVADVDEAVRVLSAWLTPTDVVLVKASRSVRLERVTEALLDR